MKDNKFLDLNPETFDISGCKIQPLAFTNDNDHKQDYYDPLNCRIKPLEQIVASEGSIDPEPEIVGSLTEWPITHQAYPKNTQLRFFGTDNKELYERNLERMPDDWIYRDKEIVYNFNNEHLRQKKDLSDVDMDNYAYFTGACYVTGIGVNEEERHSDIVCNELGLDLVTWSAPMAGIKLQVLNFLNFLKIAPRPPKILVVEHILSHIYSQYSEGEFLLYYNNVHLADPDRFPSHISAYQELLKTDFYYQESVMWTNIARVMCEQLGIKFIETSFYTKDPFIIDHNIPCIDRTKFSQDINYAFARDYRTSQGGNPYASHMGIGVYKEMADLLLTLI